jgi:hypothetical protein
VAKAKPNIQWLEAAMTALNAEPGFRKLGSADFQFGMVLGDAAKLVTFEAFRVSAVADANPADMRDADILLTMPAKDWNAYLRQRASGKGETLLSMDLARNVVSAGNPLKRLLFERYNRSIQALLDKGAALSAP